jgi:hypothetical protein
MADSEGTFGGDGSVVWAVRAANAKQGTPKQVPPVHNGGPVRHEGQDSSVPDANFRISLRIPQALADRTTLRDTLLAAAADAGAGAAGSWTTEILLAVEDDQKLKGRPNGLGNEQIEVKWQST